MVKKKQMRRTKLDIGAAIKEEVDEANRLLWELLLEPLPNCKKPKCKKFQEDVEEIGGRFVTRITVLRLRQMGYSDAKIAEEVCRRGGKVTTSQVVKWRNAKHLPKTRNSEALKLVFEEARIDRRSRAKKSRR